MSADPRYWVVQVWGPVPTTSIASGPELPSAPWNSGAPVEDDPAEPLEYTLDPDYQGNLLPMYKDESVPLIRDDTLEALEAAGVDNLQLFPAVVRDEVTGAEHENYSAFNVVGVVAAADMDLSSLMGTSDSAMIDVDFDALVLDDGKPEGLLVFRLAEAVNALVVHDSVKRTIEASGIEGIDFLGPGEWAG